ncbi:MAG: TrbG/VirB9 family P-type conjugative transfer protein [Pseudobdellovibrionaceae bacterium]
MLLRIASAILVFILPLSTWARVRTVEVKKDQIVTVKTALGVATIIQVPDRPNSIVVGDQAAFKVEYLDQAITIKPLHGSAKSNLYIYTDYRRFNVQLVTTFESAADYVVYLENDKEKEKIKSSRIGWRDYRNHLKNDFLILETKRLAKTADGVLLIEFEVRSESKEKFRPEWLWITQGSLTRPIHSLALSGQDLGAGRSIKGVIQILRDDISTTEPLKIELRRKKTSFLTIPKGAAWK